MGKLALMRVTHWVLAQLSMRATVGATMWLSMVQTCVTQQV